MAGVGDDGDADEGDDDAGHGEQSAAGGEEHGGLAVDERRNERADDERDADGDADAERHAEMAHGEAVADVADAPHGSEEGDFEEQVRVHGGVEAEKLRQQDEADADGQQNPGEEAGDGPGGFPRPVFDFLDGRVEGGGQCRAHNVPPDSGEDYRHCFSIVLMRRQFG